MSDNWYTDYSQNKRLRGLEEDLSNVSASLASARSSQRRLRAELSKVQGSMEQRLDRLSRAFDAFVEISDLRVTLGLFDDQGRVRHQARQLLRAEQTSSFVSDVPGYWLAPAYVALSVVVDGVSDVESLATARDRDPLRATVFHVLGAGLLGGRDTVTASMLADALPAFGPTMPGYQRAVWTLAADGFFGEAGWELVRRRGIEFLAGLGPEVDAVNRVRQVGTAAVRTTPLPRTIDGATELSTTLDAAARLGTLRTWVDEALGAWTNEPASAVDPSVRRCLELLVDEGSPEELPLLARERELRAVIESASGEAPAWDAPAGDTLDLLLADAADSAHPGRRAVAVRMCAEHVLTTADRLAETARLPFPPRVQVRTRRGTVTLTARGPESLDAVHRRIDAASEISAQGRVVSSVLGLVGIGFLVLTVVAGWGWAVVAIAGLLAAGVSWFKDQQSRVRAVEDAQRARVSLSEEIDQRMSTLDECRTTLLEHQSAITPNLEALRTALR
ncbi:hypothetical protein BLA60_13805 [Actinophytocola xinjiangensis]|uniref:Uncharacterized protein n=1 Tax=Actinophytocola xinjiangensis TaxID=485602 RepID=A0A7Z0WR62_9PSEU|nr:hypothetical protein [Actinophytocola xinjiangensis]OLF11073.1 hypothetical protein BLA60_13805 [Actinophytocola xinjiangensis]